MNESKRKIRIALPSKGLLADGSKQLLADVGLPVYNPNPRQYIAWIQLLPEVEVIFQRPGDIVISVRDGSVDFGITGRDIYLEKRDANGRILELHNQLGFGKCTLNVIVPDEWQTINSIADLKHYQTQLSRPLKVATKFPNLARVFFQSRAEIPIEVIQAEGALEIAPTVGYADLIVDLVSTGTTLRDNRLKKLEGGKILDAEACLIANRERLSGNSETLKTATLLLEMIGAHLRAKQNLAIFANIRANSEEEISEKLFNQEVIGGLQGPTVSRILTRDQDNFFAIHIVVKKEELHQAIRELREIGGSGVVVSPVNFIFEEQPNEILNMMAALEVTNENLQP
ncbi:MAG: ATP phosphoribosyltransferase [Anaerolineales bacterium]|nr:ATP phosphoribosyltransferase [Anaerolineales bacterium]